MIGVREGGLDAGMRPLLRGITFDAREGEFVAVLGANGAGKTTLLRALAGLRPLQQGTALLGDRPVHAWRPDERARLLGYIASDDLFSDRLSVRDVVSMGRYAHHPWWDWREGAGDAAAIDGALTTVHMNGFAQRSFDTLSSGERQRVWLAMALAQHAKVLLLDEPTSHLDVRAAHDVLRLLRAQTAAGKTVLCALHDLNEAAQYADRVLVLGEGRMLAFDAPEHSLTPGVLERAYGVLMEVLRAPSGALRIFPAAV